MKLLTQTRHFLLILLLLTLTTGCKKSDVSGGGGEPLYITLPEGKSIAFDENGGEKILALESNVSTLRVSVSPDASSWLSARITPNAVVATAKGNSNDGSRSGTLTLSGAGLSETVSVTQTGKSASIVPNTKEVTVNEYGGEITIEIVANRDFDVVIPADVAWLSLKERTGENPVILTFLVDGLTKGTRSAVVSFKAKDGSVTAETTVTQKASDTYEPQTELVVPTDFKVTPVSAVASSAQPGEELTNAVDGNLNGPLYHSAYGNGADNYFPITLEFAFDGTKDLNYLIYYPRTDGVNGRFKEIEVWGKGSALADYTLLKKVDLAGSATPSKVVFDQALLGAKSIKIIVFSGSGDGQGFASAQEIEFYQNNPDKFDLLSIFTDSSASALKAGITEADIDRIEVPVYRQIAYHLLKGDYPAEFRIASYRKFPDPDMEREWNRTSHPLSLFDNPTGIVAKKGQDLLVLVGPTGGKKLGLWVVNYDVPGGDGVGGRKILPLEEGANLLSIPQDGHLYVAYNGEDFKTAPEVKIHFPNGLVQGYYDSQKHAPEKYAELLGKATASKYFDVLGQYAHLAFPISDFRAVVPTDGKGLAELYDGLVKKEFEFLGLFKYDRVFGNRALFSVHYTDLYLYATSYHTAYSAGAIQGLLSLEGVKKESWGLAHELGHQLQTRPGVLWHGMTEVTNNIMSLYLQTEYGNASRIQSEQPDGGVYVNRYDKAYSLFQVEDYAGDPATFAYYNKLVPYLARKDGIYSGVFEMLVPLWQLQLYFSNVKGNKDFYKDVYEMARDEYETDIQRTPGQVQLDFARKASKSAGADLTDFFEKWGFFRTIDQDVDDYGNRRFTITDADVSSAKSQIALMGLPEITEKIEYISDGNWTYFRDKTPVTGSGKATLSGNIVTVPDGAYQGVVAYEFYLNGKRIAIANNTKIILPQTLTITGTKQLFAVAYDGKKTEIPL